MKKNEHLFDQSLFEKGVINYAYFLGAAVVLDTHNFKELLRNEKWTSEDEVAHEWLSQFTTLDKTYFDKMQNNKFNQEIALSFGIQGNFRRDYKTYKLKKGELSGKFGCAVMVFQPWTMFEKYGHDDVCKQIDEFIDKNKLSLFGLVCNVMNPETHKNEKSVFVYSKEQDAFANTFEDFIAAMKASDYLKCFNEHRGSFG